VRDDVLRRNVACDDDEAGEASVAGCRGGGLAQRLDDFFDAALESVVLGGCSFDELLV
jgi:hypothetical protein